MNLNDNRLIIKTLKSGDQKSIFPGLCFLLQAAMFVLFLVCFS